jgi:hypothetical protein
MDRKYDIVYTHDPQFPYDISDTLQVDGCPPHVAYWGPVRTSQAAAIMLDVLVENRAPTAEECVYMQDQFKGVESIATGLFSTKEMLAMLDRLPEGRSYFAGDPDSTLVALLMLDRRFVPASCGWWHKRSHAETVAHQRRELETRWELLRTEPDTLQFLFYPAEIRSMSEVSN